MQRSVHIIFFIAFLCGTALAAHASESKSFTISEGGRDRSYLLYRPASLSRQTPAPLVIVLHGGFGTGSQAEKAYGWDEQAYKGGFVVAYPDGVRRSWNAGGICCGTAQSDNVDDVAFITRLIHDISQSENIDPKRIYLAGISNGAAMSYRYGCEGSYTIAAIGAVAGSFSFDCTVTRPVSVMEIHGLDDHNIPMGGGIGSKGKTKVSWLPVGQTVDDFRHAANCQPPSLQQSGPVHMASSRCSAGRDVTLITIEDAGHQWPGSKAKSEMVSRLFGLDEPSTALDATSTLWDFFQAHPAAP